MAFGAATLVVLHDINAKLVASIANALFFNFISEVLAIFS